MLASAEDQATLVSILAPVKARPAGTGNRDARYTSFNPRACEGAAGLIEKAGVVPWCFNPRACEGAAILNLLFRGDLFSVSILAPVKARQHCSVLNMPGAKFQSSRL